MDAARLPWRGSTWEVRTGRSGLHTAATLLRDADPVAEGRGLGRVLLPFPGTDRPSPAVLVLAPLPGWVASTVLLVPRPREDDGEDDGSADDAVARVVDLASAERHPFDPAPGSLAARLRASEDRHPRLWASRHVVVAVAKVVAGLLGLALLLQALVRPLLRWLAGLVPHVDLPELPLPDLDLPSVPWPDVDLPDVTLPGWLAALLATAKYWGPVLVGVGLMVAEVRRERRRAAAIPDGDGPGHGDDGSDAHRRP